MNQKEVRLGKYLLGDRVGAGGMGVVYRAFDTVLQRWVALKTILADKAADKEFLSRFRREALAVSQIDHPNIVRLFDFVEGDPAKGEPSYMVMEFLPGEDLGRLIRRGPIEISRAVDIILEACAAVGTCHRRGFVHRDLKPTNIFVAEYDKIETAKILDFGAAKSWGERLQGESELSELTRKGTAVGTPEYLAPEILQGKPATPKSDQYALGVVLYTALAGRKPFAADKNAEFKEFQLWQAVAKGEHAKLRAHRADVPEGLERIVELAMHLDQARRLADIHEFGAALLPWASSPARQRWTAHFTSAPGSLLSRSVTMQPTNPDGTIPPLAEHSAEEIDPTIPAKLGNRSAVVASGEKHPPTIELSSQALAEIRSPMTSGVSISILVDSEGGPAPTVGSAQSRGNAIGRPPRRHFDRADLAALIRQPSFLLAASAAALGLALFGAALLNRARRPEAAHPAPPADLFRPVDVAAKPPTVVPIPIPPPPNAIAVPDPQLPPAANDTAGQSSALGNRKVSHRHHKPPLLDRKGVPIPSN